MRAHAVPLMLLAVLAGCEPDPVVWGDPKPIGPADGRSRLIVDTAGVARFVADTVRPSTLPAVAGLCAETLRTSQGRSLLFASWWGVRPDSSAVLYLANSPDGGRSWSRAARVDTTDVSTNGCKRPAPALTTVGDDAYVAYSMIAPEGKGVFFAHSMGNMLHTPVSVIYGERLVETSIAADEHRVAVAYEEPNGNRPQIDVAISVTQGHLFDWHATASRAVDVASSPAVAMTGPVLAVSWLNAQPSGGPPNRVVRVGRPQ
ncbi:MAG TPA: hypothetical protein VGP95_22115 [Gemmatimonadaceae bacterium]|jgi:hypothetical protein|nr:hypothetical protein [Gemmatimonadaceae bacterium]